MPSIDVSEEKIIQALDQLSPEARRKALRKLVPTAQYLERAVERNRPKLLALAEARGLDWSRLSEEQRERLIDEVLHE
jgi:hypothetical protein